MNITSQRPRGSTAMRAVLGLFALLTCLHVWTGPQPFIQRAEAQIPDSGRQRKLLLEETRRTNQLLAEIAQILRESTLNVRVAPADNQAEVPVLRRVRP